MEGERNVTEMIEETGHVSKHLKVLVDAGMVGRRKEGLQVFNSLRDPLVKRPCILIEGWQGGR